MSINVNKLFVMKSLVKIYFLPLMIYFLIQNISNQLNYWSNFPENLFSIATYILILNVIFLIDLVIFALGYATESKKLDNKTKSVEPTILGWFVVLICYPPFNTYTSDLLGWYTSDIPQFSIQFINYITGSVVILLFVIYVWATIALGWKASNLTNKGIVHKGPYKYVRHPAYTSKLSAWWLLSIPFILSQGAIAFSSMCAWTLIYYLRAQTEENHLSQDKDYVEYKKKVKWKFIPKVI